MKNIILPALLAILFLLSGSCTKKGNGNSSIDISSVIIGHWVLTGVGADLNHNNKIDTGEISSPSSGYSQTFTFTTSNKLLDTGFYGGTPVVQNYSYAFIGGNAYLQTKSIDTGSSYGSLFSYQLYGYTQTTIQLFDTSSATGYRTFYVYTKK